MPSKPIAMAVGGGIQKQQYNFLHQRKGRKRRRKFGGILSAATLSLAAFPMTVFSLGSEESCCSFPTNGCINSLDCFQACSSWSIPYYCRQMLRFGDEERRGRRRNNYSPCAYLPIELWKTMHRCRGGGDGMGMSYRSDGTYLRAGDVDEESIANETEYNENYTPRSETEYMHSSTAIINAHGKIKPMNLSSDVISASTKVKQLKEKISASTKVKHLKEKISASTKVKHLKQKSESTNEPQSPPIPHLRGQSFSPRPMLVIEFDTQAVGGAEHGNSIRSRIRSRIRTDNEWNRLPHRGPSLSISLDAFSSPSIQTNCNGNVNTIPPQYPPIRDELASNIGSSDQTLLEHLLVPTQAAIILITQTAALLPPLLLSRRALNSAWIAIVDYFRGRIFRTTFTNLERAYLRYYEFPAATRATARLVSQIVILLSLSWVVRWWMMLALSGNLEWPMALGVVGLDIGMVGTSAGRVEPAIGPGWKLGLPCHRRGKGMAWLCGLIWIGGVVGIGHLLAIALSVWGGPLRLQAVAQHHGENPKHVMRRIVSSPIKWIRELEEWKHFSSLSNFGQRNKTGEDRSRGGEGVFNPDPILFPATWLPLRWLQIFAVTKAFATDPLQYRWCSPENDKVVIPRLMKQYLVQLALGDEWHRVFLGEKRVGLGILVVFSYFVALVWMVFTTFTLDGGAAAMLIPSILAALISGLMNLMIFWNRLGTKEQRKALNAMGLA